MTSVYQGLARFGGHIRKSGGQALGTRLVNTVSDLVQLLHWDLFVLSSATPCPVGIASVRFPTHIASPFYNIEQCDLIPHNESNAFTRQ
jgi:hypothetical protein